jgi:hypothetical protein
MRKAVAVYHAPEGDNKVAEMGGVTFYHGQPVDLNSDDHPVLLAKLPGNPHFEVEIGEDDTPAPKRGPGRPRKEAEEVET